MDVGALRKVLKRYGHWRRLEDHVSMLSETQGAPVGRALTPEEQKRLFEGLRRRPRRQHLDARGRGEARAAEGRRP
jgi:hypothetical protein